MVTKRAQRHLQVKVGKNKWKRIRLALCSSFRCNQLTANLGGKCKRCLDFNARQEALLASLKEGKV